MICSEEADDLLNAGDSERTIFVLHIWIVLQPWYKLVCNNRVIKKLSQIYTEFVDVTWLQREEHPFTKIYMFADKRQKAYI